MHNQYSCGTVDFLRRVRPNTGLFLLIWQVRPVWRYYTLRVLCFLCQARHLNLLNRLQESSICGFDVRHSLTRHWKTSSSGVINVPTVDLSIFAKKVAGVVSYSSGCLLGTYNEHVSLGLDPRAHMLQAGDSPFTKHKSILERSPERTSLGYHKEHPGAQSLLLNPPILWLTWNPTVPGRHGGVFLSPYPEISVPGLCNHHTYSHKTVAHETRNYPNPVPQEFSHSFRLSWACVIVI
jgi:hypothetical protein